MAAAYVVLIVAFLQVFQGSNATPVEGRELYTHADHLSSSLYVQTELLSWFDGCTNMTVVYNDVYNYTLDLAPWLFEFSFVLGSDLSSFLTCSGLLSTIPCLIDNFEKTKDDLLKYEPDLVKYSEQGFKLMGEIKAAMESCFFHKTTLHTMRLDENLLLN